LKARSIPISWEEFLHYAMAQEGQKARD
jgi:hypothetical protein